MSEFEFEPSKTQSGTPALDAALLKAQQKLRTLLKDAENTHHGFTYVSADAAVNQAREALHEFGLVPVVVDGPRLTVLDLGRVGPVDAGRTSPLVEVTMTIALRHAESGEQIKVRRSLVAEPGKGRPLDKAILGAETAMIGYWIRGLLFVPRFDKKTDPSARDDEDFDPSVLGLFVYQWVAPTCEKLGISVAQLRAAMAKRGADKATLEQHPTKWPVAWKGSIIEGLSDVAKKQNAVISSPPPSPEAAMAALPQSDRTGDAAPPPQSLTPTTTPTTTPGAVAPTDGGLVFEPDQAAPLTTQTRTPARPAPAPRAGRSKS